MASNNESDPRLPIENRVALTFAMIGRNKRLPDIMQAAATISEADEQGAPESVSNELLQAFVNLAPQIVRNQAGQFVLVTGCLIHLFALASNTTSRRGLRKAFFRRLGISPSQGYRCEDVWKRFGAALLAESNLTKAFTAGEPLKLLAASSTPEAARAESLDLARQGKEIDTRTAEELIRKHLHGAESDESVAARPSDEPRLWKFVGAQVRILISGKPKSEFPNPEGLIHELEAAIKFLRG
jgi:hypothetical protein